MELLERYSWPGNVRELEHTIERAVALERADTIQPESLPQSITNYNPVRAASSAFELPDEGINLTAHLEHLEKTYLLEALRRTGGNQTRAAEILHLSVRSLRHLLDKHSIRNLTAQLRSDAAGRGGSDS
jgi:DNA-binding NtrC family response regulator